MRFALRLFEEHVKHGVKLWYAGAALAALAACGMDASDKGFAAGGDPGSGNGSGTGGSSPDPGGQPQEPEPEQEVDQAFQVPVVSGRWVWTANPVSGAVALIDAKTFAVRTAPAGAGPSQLAALPTPAEGGSRAVVINGVSQDATVLTADEDGAITTSESLPLHFGANAWAISPDGRFAIAWTNAAAAQNPDPSDGFQDITVLTLDDEPSSKRLSVGYRPVRVFMDDDSRYAYFVTDAGIDVVDLLAPGGPVVERELSLSANPARDTAKRDVNVTPDGAYAFVSRQGKSYVTVVDVAAGTFTDVPLPGVVTDLDLSADATLAVAIVQAMNPSADLAAGAGASGQAGESAESEGGGAGVEQGGGGGLDAGAGGADGSSGGAAGAGGSGNPPQGDARSLVVLLPVASIFDDPKSFRSVAIGSESFASVELTAGGATALLYQNGAPSSHLTLLGLDAEQPDLHRTLDLKLPIFSAVPTPDGEHALVLLKPPADAAKPGAFAVAPIGRDLPAALQGTVAATVPADLAAAQPAMVAVADEHALVTVSDGKDVHVAYLVRMPALTIDAIPLSSAPLRGASGIVPEVKRAFVAQQHPAGRITFIDLESGAERTLTGFELSSQVKQ